MASLFRKYSQFFVKAQTQTQLYATELMLRMLRIHSTEMTRETTVALSRHSLPFSLSPRMLLMWLPDVLYCNSYRTTLNKSIIVALLPYSRTRPNDKLTGRKLLHTLLIRDSSPSSVEQVYVELLQWQVQIKRSQGTKKENIPPSLKIDLPGYWSKGQSDIVNANICAEPCSTKCPNPKFEQTLPSFSKEQPFWKALPAQMLHIKM